MEKLGGIEKETDHDADLSNESELKAYLERIKLQQSLEDAISTYQKRNGK